MMDIRPRSPPRPVRAVRMSKRKLYMKNDFVEDEPTFAQLTAPVAGTVLDANQVKGS